jgi:hypothetical protein
MIFDTPIITYAKKIVMTIQFFLLALLIVTTYIVVFLLDFKSDDRPVSMVTTSDYQPVIDLVRGEEESAPVREELSVALSVPLEQCREFLNIDESLVATCIETTLEKAKNNFAIAFSEFSESAAAQGLSSPVTETYFDDVRSMCESAYGTSDDSDFSDIESSVAAASCVLNAVLPYTTLLTEVSRAGSLIE